MIRAALLTGMMTGICLAAPVTFIQNGGFETGDLTNWTTTGLGTTGTCPNGNRDWNVGSTGGATGCSDPGAPPAGTYAAYNMFDASGPTTYSLTQSFAVGLIPLLNATLAWSDAATWSITGADRVFSVDILNGATVLQNFYTLNANGVGSYTWTGRSFDVTSLLNANLGNTLTLRFQVSIPETWTGPAGLGVDAVSLDGETIPEPATFGLLGAGLVIGSLVRRRMKA